MKKKDLSLNEAVSIVAIMDFINYRLSMHRESIREVASLENERRRHPAYKQVHGRILELQYLKKEINRRLNNIRGTQ